MDVEQLRTVSLTMNGDGGWKEEQEQVVYNYTNDNLGVWAGVAGVRACPDSTLSIKSAEPATDIAFAYVIPQPSLAC